MKKIKAVLQYMNGKISQPQGAKENGVSVSAFQTWIRKYKAEGEDELKPSKKNKISSNTQLRDWVKWYNGHKGIKERSSAKGEIYK